MSVWKRLDSFVLALGLYMFIGVLLFGQSFQHELGKIAGIFFDPLLNVLPFHIIILILASITGLYASLIQKYTMDWELTRRVQERMKTIQKEFREAQLSGNAAKLKKLEAQRMQMMEDQMAMMKQQFKPMLYIGIISLPLFMWLAYIAMPAHPDAALVFPFWGEQVLKGSVWIIPYWLFWYFISSIPVSQVIRKALNIGGT